MVVIQSEVSGLEEIARRFFGSQASQLGFQRDLYLGRLEHSVGVRGAVSGAELLVMSLEALSCFQPGVRHIAGQHGGAILPFFEHFSRSPLFGGYIHVPHEQLAGHLAEGFAAVSGKPGVAVATSGPGATNLVTPLYNSAMDSTPLVGLTGNVATSVAGSMAFQEADICGMLRGRVKAVYYVDSGSLIPDVVFKAFYVAGSGRPGPVLVDFPKDVLAGSASVDLESVAGLVFDYSGPSPMELALRVNAARELVERSVKPVLYVGQGVAVANASQELVEFVDRTGIPVAMTLKGKGVFPESDSRSLGMLGMHGHVVANYAVNEADLVVAVGARFDDRVTGNYKDWALNARIVHLDIDPRGVGPKGARQPDVVVPADVKLSLSMLNYALSGFKGNNLSAWYRELSHVKENFPTSYSQGSGGLVNPQFVIDCISKEAGSDAVFVTGVGQHQMWLALYSVVDKPSSFVTPGGAGTMGVGLPGALGAWVGLLESGREGNVVLVDGDESFRMTPHALELYRRLNADVAVFVIDNKAPDGTPGGMVRQWYELVHHNTKVPVQDSPSIESIARGFGVPAKTVSRAADVVPAVREALSISGPRVYVFKVDPWENCLPMVPGGGSFRDQIAADGRRVCDVMPVYK